MISFGKLLGLKGFEIETKELNHTNINHSTKLALLGQYGERKDQEHELPEDEPSVLSKLDAIYRAVVMTLVPSVPGGHHPEAFKTKSKLTSTEAHSEELSALGFISLARLFISRSFHLNGSFAFIYKDYQELSETGLKNYIARFFDEGEKPFEVMFYEQDMVSYLKFLKSRHPLIFNQAIQELVLVLDESMKRVGFDEFGATQLANQILTERIIKYLEFPLELS